MFEVKHQIEREKGFTVLEMLVVIGVTAILSSMFVGYGVSLRSQTAVFREEAALVQELMRVKTNSIQALSEEGLGVACGYGIHIDKEEGKYFIFRKEKTADGKCPGLDREDDYAWKREGEIRGEIKQIDERVSIGRDSNVTDVVFLPPNPTVVLLPSFGVSEEGKIVLCAKSEGEFCRQVTVNLVGQIDSGRVK